MTEVDFPNFEQSFRRLMSTFRLRLKPAQFEELTRNYFKILDTANVEDVLAGAKKCLASCRRFPTPADWLLALPVSTAGTAEAKDIRVMSADETAEYHRAERLRYEDAPCSCLLCQSAHVTHHPLRFVPEFLDDEHTTVKAFDNVRNRIVSVGHWAHGDELGRWYVARAKFFASVPRSGPVRRALALVGQAREPGEEG